MSQHAMNVALALGVLTQKEIASCQWVYVGEHRKGYTFKNVLTNRLRYA